MTNGKAQPEGVEELVERTKWLAMRLRSHTPSYAECDEAADMIEALARLGGVGDGQK